MEDLIVYVIAGFACSMVIWYGIKDHKSTKKFLETGKL